MDCPDHSDEVFCDLVDFGTHYGGQIVPRPTLAAPLAVTVGVSVLSVPAIATYDLKFTVDFYVTLRWRDSRLQFRNLKETSSANALSKEDKERLWRPTLVMYNALGPLHTVVDEETKAEVVREGEPEVNGIEEQQAGAASFIMLLRFFSHFLAVRDLNKS